MNNKVKISVETSSTKFVNYLITHDIKYSDLIKNEYTYTLITEKENYKKIRRRYTTKIIRYYGINYYKNLVIVNKYMLLSFLVSLFLLNVLTNTIFSIEINCEDEALKDKIIKELENNNIKKYKKIKSYEELNLIKENIKENVEEVEWIEITRVGCDYIIDITPKIVYKEEELNQKTNIIASKDGVIKHIVVHSGEKIKEENEYVKKGEIIISGNVFKDEEIVNTVESKGEVYAEVWYLAKVVVPLEYKEIRKSDNIINHYYIEIFNQKMTILGKYEKQNTQKTTYCILDKPYLPFKLYKEVITDYEEVKVKLSQKEALEKALEMSENKIKENLSAEEYIISKNVLKNTMKSSKMYIEVFFKVYEEIGVTSNIDEKENINEERNS